MLIICRSQTLILKESIITKLTNPQTPQICTNIKSHKWTETRTADGTYAQSSSQWASYLRPEEVSRIAESLHAARARGAALWALDLDDWRGHCSCRPHPLLRALRRGLLQLDTEMC